ncbi:trypsin [Pilimelia anulata]|uniref:Trypsin n=1 Tax=Pilimelia anulata TaxID=53371 RepID=A0A8J3AZB2_9ACTN|nr:trypsin-like serine protease [Pilimelia anulata]GGJ78594.1 trypsin [Pilimelia anulata]
MRTSPSLAAAAAVVAALGLVAVPASAAPTPTHPIADGERPAAGPRIVGGERATGSLPWITALWAGSKFNCTASLIAAEWVLTAKHCVDAASLNVRIGSLTRSSGGTTADVARVLKSPGNNDVALLRLSRAVEATYIKVAAQGSLSVGTRERVYGWGYERSDWTGLPENLKTSTGSVTELNCSTQFGDIACIRNSGDTSGGDSGGPMINSSGEQIGVCAMGNKPTNGTGFGGYNTVVSSTVRNWIRQNAGV